MVAPVQVMGKIAMLIATAKPQRMVGTEDLEETKLARKVMVLSMLICNMEVEHS